MIHNETNIHLLYFTLQGEFMDVMAGEPSLILWDLHLEEEYQRKGLGKHILTLLEFVARREGMRYLSVPVMLEDEVSLNWLTKAGGGKFSPDAGLRRMIDFDPEEEGFNVYCKELIPPVARAPAPASVVETPSKAKIEEQTSPTSVFDLAAMASALTPAQPASTSTSTSAFTGMSPSLQATSFDDMPLTEAIGKLQELYFERHQREPTQEEVTAWRLALSADDEEQDK